MRVRVPSMKARRTKVYIWTIEFGLFPKYRSESRAARRCADGTVFVTRSGLPYARITGTVLVPGVPSQPEFVRNSMTFGGRR